MACPCGSARPLTTSGTSGPGTGSGWIAVLATLLALVGVRVLAGKELPR